jgi:hypothetical protein
MPRALFTLAAFLCPLALSAHITPNVELVRRGEFLRQGLPEAARFFEKQMMISRGDGTAIRKATGWVPSEEDTKIYVGRDARSQLVGTVVFLWMPSQHGPLGIGVVFRADGAVRRVAVTDVGSEPLAWVRPLIDGGGLAAFEGLSPGAAPDPSRVAPLAGGSMSRYYARVIADGVTRAQAVQRVVAQAAKS